MNQEDYHSKLWKERYTNLHCIGYKIQVRGNCYMCNTPTSWVTLHGLDSKGQEKYFYWCGCEHRFNPKKKCNEN